MRTRGHAFIEADKVIGRHLVFRLSSLCRTLQSFYNTPSSQSLVRVFSSMESRHFKTRQIFFFCPVLKCLVLVLHPRFIRAAAIYMNSAYTICIVLLHLLFCTVPVGVLDLIMLTLQDEHRFCAGVLCLSLCSVKMLNFQDCSEEKMNNHWDVVNHL